MGKKFLVASAGLGFLFVVSSASAVELAPHVQGEMIVRMRDGTRIEATATFKAALSAVGAKDMGALSLAPRFRKVKVLNDATLQNAITQISLSPEVLYAEPNFIYRAVSFTASDQRMDDYVPADIDYKNQWALNNVGQKFDEKDRPAYFGKIGFDIGITRLWNEHPETLKAAADMKVAIIDTGINYKHQDLAENIWTNTGEVGPLTAAERAKAPKGCADKNCDGIDNDGNGLVDDWHGWNWSVQPKGDQPIVGNNDPLDDNGHGSHVSGVIGARHNRANIAGINDRVQLMAVKFLTKDGEGSLEGAAQAVIYAGKMGADVINASWGGGGDSQVLEEVVSEVTRGGTLFVAAAGNTGMDNDLFDTWPANYNLPGLISVAASEPRGGLAFFSCYGKTKVHITAPGHLIISTVLKNNSETMSGTSMATPHVVGVAALVLGMHPEMRRQPALLRERLMKSSEMGVAMLTKTASGGNLNAYNAVMGVVPNGHNRPTSSDWGAMVAQPLESPHPYVNSAEIEQTIHVPGAKWIRVRIGRHSIETGKDNLEIYDAQGNLFDAITGFGLTAVTQAVQGDTVKLVFRSDATVTGWGYEVLGYEVIQ